MQEVIKEDISGPKIVQWLLDTRSLWPVSPRAKANEEVQELRDVAIRAFNLLSKTEQESVLKYHHIKDAKMSLASYLLKYIVINKYLGIPWSKITICHNSHGKPCFLNSSQESCIDFNVSHQAGIVTLLAVISNRGHISVGTDIVCTDERKSADYAYIEDKGFYDWVHIYEDVFADSEVSYLRKGSLRPDDIGISIKESELTNQARHLLERCERKNEKVNINLLVDGKQKTSEVDSNVIIDVKLRQFYALWCIREAFVKMTGEALLAPWLKDLEILTVRAPKAKNKAVDLEEGEVIKDVRIILKNGEQRTKFKVADITVQLTALGQGYMVVGVIHSPDSLGPVLEMGKWQKLDLSRDILQIAEQSL